MAEQDSTAVASYRARPHISCGGTQPYACVHALSRHLLTVCGALEDQFSAAASAGLLDAVERCGWSRRVLSDSIRPFSGQAGPASGSPPRSAQPSIACPVPAVLPRGNDDACPREAPSGKREGETGRYSANGVPDPPRVRIVLPYLPRPGRVELRPDRSQSLVHRHIGGHRLNHGRKNVEEAGQDEADCSPPLPDPQGNQRREDRQHGRAE